MGTSGMPTEFTMGTPEDVKGLRAQLIALLSSGLNKGATPYGGPIAPQTNPLQLGAANMLQQMMGYGPYQQPGMMMNPYGTMGGGGDGGGGGGVGPLPPLGPDLWGTKTRQGGGIGVETNEPSSTEASGQRGGKKYNQKELKELAESKKKKQR